ncbi:hypothetical protein ACOSP7_019461 [Xanthoceras sorbifolium]
MKDLKYCNSISIYVENLTETRIFATNFQLNCLISTEKRRIRMARTEENIWSTGLCDCSSDMKSCCLTFWCPCVTFGRIAHIVDEGDCSCCVAGTLFCLTRGSRLDSIFSFFYRHKMRQQYKLSGSCCGDFCSSLFCLECALCQQYRELQNRGFDMSLDWEENMRRKPHGVAMAPVVEGGMKR